MRADLQRLKRDSDSGRSAAVVTESDEIEAPPVRPSSRKAKAAPSNQPLSAKSPRRSPWKVLLPVAAVAAALIAGGYYYWRSRATTILTDKDSIVLADFTNTTGDPVFDTALRAALAAQLGQSPLLNLVPDEQIANALTGMTKPNDTGLTHQLAREVCQRLGGKATLEGAMAYLAAQQGTPAAAQFQKILDHPGVFRNEPIGALARLGLGRAYAMAGDNAKAKTAYQDFLTL
ncbi:MAG: hypothetical protein JO319_07970 [Acidobacteriaceae bacterium]|nr:hypothetical protein [Acidobacteriaceae bacterium]